MCVYVLCYYYCRERMEPPSQLWKIWRAVIISPWLPVCTFRKSKFILWGNFVMQFFLFACFMPSLSGSHAYLAFSSNRVTFLNLINVRHTHYYTVLMLNWLISPVCHWVEQQVKVDEGKASAYLNAATVCCALNFHGETSTQQRATPLFPRSPSL